MSFYTRIVSHVGIGPCALFLSTSLWASDEDLGSFLLGEVPSKTVWHGMPYSFLVQWEGHPACEMTVVTNPVPAGAITLQVVSEGEPGWWKLTYNADSMDKFPFTVILTGIDGAESLSQAFDLEPMASLPPEQVVFDPTKHTQSGLIEFNDPAPQITTAGNTISMNYQTVHPKTVLIRRQTIEIQQGHANGYYEMFNGQRDIQTMEMIGETVIIRSPLRLPQTNVIIRARELRMEGPTAAIITTPEKNTSIPSSAVIETINENGTTTVAGTPGGSGVNGLPAGSITLEIENLVVTDSRSFGLICEAERVRMAATAKTGSMEPPSTTIGRHLIFGIVEFISHGLLPAMNISFMRRLFAWVSLVTIIPSADSATFPPADRMPSHPGNPAKGESAAS